MKDAGSRAGCMGGGCGILDGGCGWCLSFQGCDQRSSTVPLKHHMLCAHSSSATEDAASQLD